MRTFLSAVLALVILLALFVRPAAAQERRVADLTANDLAEALGVHWWIVKLPPDLGPNGGIKVELVSANGQRLDGGPGFFAPNLGKEARIYCYEVTGSSQMKVLITTERGESSVLLDDYFKNSVCSGASNGSVVASGDILLKFDKAVGSGFTGGNQLKPGQIGLKVIVSKRE